MIKESKDEAKVNPGSGGLMPVRRVRNIGASGGSFPLVRNTGAYRNKVQRLPTESISQAMNQPVIETAPMGEVNEDEPKTIEASDVEKVADMVYRMLRQDLIVEMERLSVAKRLI